MARGATFDCEIEERIGDAIGKEIISLGGNTFGGVCVNLLRHPAWGRAQETFGEDPMHVGAMGASIVRGVERYANAVVKHFALNSMENARFFVDVHVEERTLHEVYLRHFKRIIMEEKASFVMSSYNQVNGHYAGENNDLLNLILKQKWGFKGAIMTDFVFGLRDAKKSMLSGQDLEMPFKQTFDAKLPGLIKSGEVPMERLDDAVLRLMRVQRRHRQSVPSTFSKGDHAALALQAAEESIVLLKNQGNLLPLKAGTKPLKVALIGALAKVANTGDHGSSNTQPEHVVTCEEGLVHALGKENVTFNSGDDLEACTKVALAAEVVILVVGYSFKDEGEFVIPKPRPEEMALFPKPKLGEVYYLLKMMAQGLKDACFGRSNHTIGEGGDRTSLQLGAHDEALIEAVASVNENVIVVVMSGSAFICEKWRNKVRSILCLWYGDEMVHFFWDKKHTNE